ncbi:MAG: threonine/serine exporter family protein [Bacillota bacterium]|nr:threonine/serine exporter family protein [Bacillota bacterium]
MDQKRQKEILILASKAGKIMMKSGAEIYRVEDTISRICLACGMDHVNVLALPTGIFIAINNEDHDDTITYIKRIKSTETDLNKISAVNEFSRQFTTTDLTIEEGLKILDKIEKSKKYPFWARALSAAIVTSCFSVLFGGNAIDFGISFIVGVTCYMMSRLLETYGINFFIRGLLCCAWAAFCALVASASIDGTTYSCIITGCVMLFVPGIAITNAIRDFLSGDLLAGLARLTEAALIGVSIAAGAGIVIEIWNALGGFVL